LDKKIIFSDIPPVGGVPIFTRDEHPLMYDSFYSCLQSVKSLEVRNQELIVRVNVLNSEKKLVEVERDYYKFWFRLLRSGSYVQIILLFAVSYYLHGRTFGSF
jgi:hypothetical protein